MAQPHAPVGGAALLGEVPEAAPEASTAGLEAAASFEVQGRGAGRPRERRSTVEEAARASIVRGAQLVRSSFAKGGRVVDEEGNDGSLPNACIPEPEQQRTITEQVQELRKSTLLSTAAMAELELESPSLVTYLTSLQGFVMQAVLFATFVGIDAGKSMMLSEALKGTGVIPQTMTITISFVSLVTGLAITYSTAGMEGIHEAFGTRTLKQFGLIAALFAVAQTFQNMSYTVLSAGTIKICGQVRPLQTALLSTLFLGRRYLPSQWSALLIIMLAVIMFMQGKADQKEMDGLLVVASEYQANRTLCYRSLEQQLRDSVVRVLQPPEACRATPAVDTGEEEVSSMAIGLGYVGCYVFLSDVSSIISEKYLKAAEQTPFYIQKVGLEIWGLPTSVLMSVLMPWIFGKESHKWWRTGVGFFKGWRELFPFPILIALFLNTVQSWLSGIIVKKMSSVMKLLGKVASLTVVYFLADCWLLREEGKSPPVLCTVAQFVVMLGTYTYLSIKPDGPMKKHGP